MDRILLLFFVVSLIIMGVFFSLPDLLPELHLR